MTPRPHLASFFGTELPKRFLMEGSRKSDGLGGLRGSSEAAKMSLRWPAPGGRRESGWRTEPGVFARAWILGGEAVVLLAVLFVVARVSTDADRTVWQLAWLSLALVVLSLLRRRLFPADEEDGQGGLC